MYSNKQKARTALVIKSPKCKIYGLVIDNTVNKSVLKTNDQLKSSEYY